ncbi:hypothetical protein IWX49DRAFT_44630 [Phyllosticta citricarpa]|uniref:Uncharacterized protein n=1 Tax=Phyllosticta citricarpa TaxID=55181 RepID=A0ABR1MIG3_9PEZI
MRVPPSLMDLPRELRDCIWEACLTIPSSRPASPDPNDYVAGNTPNDETVYYPTPNVNITSVSLLCVNRAANAEVHATILRLYAHRRVNSKLNILTRNEKFLRLDWLLLPVNSVHYDNLEVDFRFTGQPSWHGPNGLLPSVPDQSFFQVFYPEPNPKILYCLAAILSRFQKWGPGFEGPPRTTRPPRKRSIGCLSLNIVTPSLPPERFRKRCDLVMPRRLRNTREAWKSYYTGIVHPKAVVLEFEMLLWRTLIAPRKMSCTSNFYESIETIDIRLDGQLLKTWNVRSLTGQLFQAAFLQSRLRVLDHNCSLPVEERFGSFVEKDAKWQRREGRGNTTEVNNSESHEGFRQFEATGLELVMGPHWGDQA